MKEYIDREDVRRFFQLGENCDTCQRDPYECTYHEKVSLMDVCGMLDDIPTVDAELVVRCKDCRHRDPEDHKCECGEDERQGCPFPVDDDYYCAYGKR